MLKHLTGVFIGIPTGFLCMLLTTVNTPYSIDLFFAGMCMLVGYITWSHLEITHPAFYLRIGCASGFGALIGMSLVTVPGIGKAIAHHSPALLLTASTGVLIGALTGANLGACLGLLRSRRY